MQPIDLAIQTTFAELFQRTLDTDFDEQFPERGSFRRKKSKDRFYWQFQWRDGASVRSRYVGPVTDKAITERVLRFEQIKSDYKGRRQLIRSLIAAGLPTPDRLSGDIIEAMGRAGFFRLRGVLVGTLAYQAYAGILGVRLGARQLMTQDADFAQFWGISENVGDAMKSPLEILKPSMTASEPCRIPVTRSCRPSTATVPPIAWTFSHPIAAATTIRASPPR